MKRLMIAITALGLLAAGAARAADESNQPPAKVHGGPPGGPGGPRAEMPLIGPKLMDELKLTSEQEPKVKALEDEFDKQRDKLRADLKNNPDTAKLRDEIRTAHDAGDNEKVKSLREKQMALQKPLLDLRKQYMDKVRALLTDDQKKTLDQARERVHDRWGPGAPKGEAPPPPPPPNND